MSEKATGTKPVGFKATSREMGRGLGKDAPYYVIAAGVVADSLNKRYGLGLTEQEIISVVVALAIGAARVKTWLEN